MIIGYTTGVFDMFHIGHLNILRRAKEQCDYLIVGVSTDELVQHDKNKTPIIPFNDRCAIVEAIKYVDQIVPQPDKNKLEAWEKYHFNKMFVGSDWQGTSAWKKFEEQFSPIGVEIIYLSHTDGISSSILREKKSALIPKIIHYCWFGGNPLPKDAQRCITSWKKYLPEYEIKEWNENNFDVNCCSYVREAYEAKKYAFVSDYARFYALYHEGGLYFDTDVEVVKNMDHIVATGNFMGFEKSLATQQTSKNVNELGVAPGLGLGVAPGLDLIRELLDFYEAKDYFSVEDGTVVDYTTEILKLHGLVNENKLQKIANVTIYPADYFCPMDSTTGILTLTDNTVSIHHYSCSWINHNTMNWYLHILKNKLIALFGEKWVMKISKLLKQ